MDTRRGLQWPADLYLEGADQYRGWFQSSLLTAVARHGQGAPYKAVLTHGWTVDGEGKAMHKSLGNAVEPEDIIKKYGADILRLWASSADYHADVRCSDAHLQAALPELPEVPQHLPAIASAIWTASIPARIWSSPRKCWSCDQWVITKLNEPHREGRCKAYCDYEFHIITHAVNDFCVNDAFELLSRYRQGPPVLRGRGERLPAAARRPPSTSRSTRLSKLFAPILAFTCDEIWLAMPHTGDDDARNVVLNEMNKPFTAYALTAEEMANWEKLAEVRDRGQRRARSRPRREEDRQEP